MSKVYRLLDKSWLFVSEASAFAARLAAYSTALVDLLIRANELEVSEEDKASVHGLLLDLSARNFSQASRMNLHTTKRRRDLALSSLILPRIFFRACSRSYLSRRSADLRREVFGGGRFSSYDV